MDGGKSFFLYSFKYAERLKRLKRNYRIFELLDDISGAGNGYLRKVYRAAIFYYYDKFGEELFETFAIYLFLILAYYRSESGSVNRKGVVKFQWGSTQELNPFKLIMLKYSPEHVVNTLIQYIKYYCQEKPDWYKFQTSDGKAITGTKKRFFDDIPKTFEKTRDELINRLWE
jgi:hypothetical protein